MRVARRSRSSSPHDERGSAALELVLITPALILLLLLVVAGGRIVEARNRVDAAARDAARAGTIARSPRSASAAATEAASARLGGGDVSCRSLSVNVDTSRFGPGGSVTAMVTCVVDLGDLTSLRLPGSKTVTATATETVDTYRGTGP